MPASSIALLLDYERNYEDAIQTHLENVLTGVQVLTPRDNVVDASWVTTPRVTVQVQITGTNPNQQANRSTDQGEYDSHKLASVSFECAVQRNNTSQSMTNVVGGVRKALLQPTAALNANTLPYYQTITLRESASSPTFDAGNDEIARTLSYALEFYIKPTEWPAS